MEYIIFTPDLTHLEVVSEHKLNSLSSQQLAGFLIEERTKVSVPQPLNDRSYPFPGIPFSSKTPNDPLYPYQWNFELIEVEKAWNNSTGKGARVAIIDTGIAITRHRKGPATDFRDGVVTHWVDVVNDLPEPYDDNEHGTHCAGTVAQATNNQKGCAGIAYNSDLVGIKVLDGTGSGYVDWVAQGIMEAVKAKVHIISMSLGASSPSTVIERACQIAHDAGILIIAAAGNSGGKVGYPAAYPTVLSVSAVDRNRNITKYSCRGKIDIAAPGGYTRDSIQDGILQNVPTYSGEDYEYFMGTSMACPHVAGVAALLVSLEKSPKEAGKILLETATPGNNHTKENYGAGIVNAKQAVCKAVGLTENPND